MCIPELYNCLPRLVNDHILCQKKSTNHLPLLNGQQHIEGTRT